MIQHLCTLSKPMRQQLPVSAGSHKGSNSLFHDCYQNDELVNDTYFQVSSTWRTAPLHKAANSSRSHCSHAHSLDGSNIRSLARLLAPHHVAH